MEMTKFTSPDDPGFLAVCGEMRRWIKEMVTEGDWKKASEGTTEPHPVTEQPVGPWCR